MVPSFVRAPKRKPAVLRCGFVVHVCEIGCLIDLTWQPIDGGLLPRRGFLTAYTVERRKLRSPEAHPYFAQRTVRIQMMRIAVTQNVMAVSDFCT